tara:strand:+ start:48542 stop:49804 length:1263 start_codon:yes stop_codon:yes gene_type:complete
MNLDYFKITKNSLVNNSFYLYLSHFADYILTLFLLPFIARAIGAIKLGEIGLSQTFGLLIVLFMEFGSSLMATREIARIKDDQIRLKRFVEKLTIFKIFLLPIACIASALSIIFVPIFSNNPHYVVIVVLGAISQGISPTWYFQGIQKMKIIALSKLFFRLISFIAIIFFVKSSNDAWIVLASFSLTSILICLYLYFKIIKKLGPLNFTNPAQSKFIFTKSIPSLLITIIPIIYQNISVIILSIFVNPIQLGLYYGANRIYRGFNTLYSPISQAFFPIISSINNKNKTEARLLIRKYLLFIIIIGLFFFVTIYFLAEEIILIFLGNKFSASNNILRLFSIVLPLTAVTNALGRQWLMVINKDFFYSFIQLFSSLIAFIAFLFFINGFGIKAFPISLIVYEVSAIIMIIAFLISNGRTKIT